jgi:uncharacterized membrane protein
MADRSVVLAIFHDESAADAAVASLKAWDKTDDRVKLSAIGVLVLDDNGNVKTHKMGSRNILKGGGIGLALAMIVPPLGVAAGVAGGGAAGAMRHKGLGMTDKEKDRLSAKLFDGKAAVGVLATPDEAPLIKEKLLELGGEPAEYAVSDANLKQAAAEEPGFRA